MPTSVGADPALLEQFRSTSEGLDDALLRQANNAASALAGFAGPGVAAAWVGPALAGLVAASRTLSDWVGGVAQAFRRADGEFDIGRPVIGGSSIDRVAEAMESLRVAVSIGDARGVASQLRSFLAPGGGWLPARAVGSGIVRLLASELSPSLLLRVSEIEPDLLGNLEGWPPAGRYAANRTRLEVAAGKATGERRSKLLALLRADPGTGANRQFLSFDPSGEGRVAEVLGDLDSATNVGFYVPGMSSDLEHFDGRVAARARALLGELSDQNPRRQVAIVAWLGYDSPDDLPSPQAFSANLARAGGGQLEHAVSALRPNAEQTVSLVGHSYGTVVIGSALQAGVRADNVVVMGSPGVLVNHAEEFDRPETDFFTMETPGDLVTSVGLYGRNPNRIESGFERLETGGRGHSGYLLAGGVGVANVAAVILDDDGALDKREEHLIERVSRPVVAVEKKMSAVHRSVDEWQDEHVAASEDDSIWERATDGVLNVGIDVVQDQLHRARPQREAAIVASAMDILGGVGRAVLG